MHECINCSSITSHCSTSNKTLIFKCYEHCKRWKTIDSNATSFQNPTKVWTIHYWPPAQPLTCWIRSNNLSNGPSILAIKVFSCSGSREIRLGPSMFCDRKAVTIAVSIGNDQINNLVILSNKIVGIQWLYSMDIRVSPLTNT